ncbi:MAG: cytochrome c [Acidobacteria bacterium]|nr:cytochrome c [Acidobacteriota bacterium]
MTKPILCTMLWAAGSAMAATPVTFHKDVLPVLQKNCQTCHRPGEAAPMAFLTYKETRPWAKAIREAVASGKMPPWTAESGAGKKFHNDRTMSARDKQVLSDWVESGAPEGNAADAPPAVRFVEGWIMGKPDKVWQLPEAYTVPASGTVEYTYYIIPNAFPEDTWIESAEIRPDARPVVHHVIAYVRPPGSTWLNGHDSGQFFVPAERKAGVQQPPNLKPSQWRQWIAGYAPGVRPHTPVKGGARLVPAGSDLVFELHYTAAGKPMPDRSSVGIILAKEKPEHRVVTSVVLNTGLKIPAGADNHRVDASVTLAEPVTMLSVTPHMHLRGKAFEYRAIYPTGESEVLLRVPKYDFNWQISYEFEKPLNLPKGTRIECTAHYDNSANNRFNPDPSKEVKWGDQSWEEMFAGFMELSLNLNQDPDTLFEKAKKPPVQTAANR